MSNSISFTCDCCGREVGGCNIVNGMKFCAKCYQETFGNQKKYVDMLHKETGELLVNLLAEKDKQIAELQKQLERHNKYFNSFSCDNFDEFADFISTFMLTPHEEQILIKDLKKQLEEKEKKIEKLREWLYQCEADRKSEQEKKNLAFKELRKRSEQLKSQPAEIVEKIKKQIFNHFNVKNMEEHENLSLIDSLFTADAVIEMLDTILKEY